MSEISVLDSGPGFRSLVNNWLDVIDASINHQDDTGLREVIAMKATEIAFRYPEYLRDTMTRILLNGTFMVAKDIRAARNGLTMEDFDV